MGRPLDPFNDYRKPHMAAGDVMFRGMAVVISPNVPKVHIGDEIIPVLHGRLYRWAYWLWCRKEAPPKTYRQGARIEEEQILQSQNKLFMTQAAWDQIKKQIQSIKEDARKTEK